jgi:TniQ
MSTPSTFVRCARLPVVPRPAADELLSSWIERTACFYGVDYETWLSYLMSQAGDLPSPGRHDADQDERIRAVLEGITDLGDAHVPLVIAGVGRDTLARTARIAFCSRCWDDDVARGEQPYVRRQWANWHHVVCAVHCAFLSAREMTGARQMPVTPTWTVLWRARSSWAAAMDVSHDPESDEKALWYSPGSGRGFSFAQLRGVANELARLDTPGDSDAIASPRPLPRLALDLALSDGFAGVVRDVRGVLLGPDGDSKWTTTERNIGDYFNDGERPLLLETRMGIALTAAELTCLAEARHARIPAVRTALRNAMSRRQVFDHAGTAKFLSHWPKVARDRLIHAGNP